MYPILLEIGWFRLRSYGVFVALAIVLGTWLSAREARRNGLDPEWIFDFALYAVVAGIAGARLYYILFLAPRWFLQHPQELFAIWHGGLAFHGGLLAGVGTALWFCRRRGIALLRLGDTVAPGLILGQTVGQIACLLNGDTYGRATTLPWAITFTDPSAAAPLGVPLHPIQVYELLAYLAVFLLVWVLRGRFTRSGQLFAIYLIGYAVARFAMEFFRGDPPVVAGIIVPQALSVAAAIAGATLLVRLPRRPGLFTPKPQG